jgi:hypothetical protein
MRTERIVERHDEHAADRLAAREVAAVAMTAPDAVLPPGSARIADDSQRTRDGRGDVAPGIAGALPPLAPTAAPPTIRIGTVHFVVQAPRPTAASAAAPAPAPAPAAAAVPPPSGAFDPWASAALNWD